MTASLVTTGVQTRTRLNAGLRYLPTAALGIDLTLIAASVLIAVLGRGSFAFSRSVSADSVGHTLDVVGPLMIIGWVLAIYAAGGYRRELFGAGVDEYKLVVNASLATAALVGITCYLTHFPLSRGFFILTFTIGFPMLVAGRWSLRRSVHRARRYGALQHRVVIAGSEAHVDEIAIVLRR